MLTDEELRLLAYHEGGHAVVGATLPNADPVHKVTIIPRGRSMGSTRHCLSGSWRRDELLDKLALTLGGRAAEQLIFDTVTSGAEDDLRTASRLARKMVMSWGMSSFQGPFASDQDGEPFLGEQIARPRELADQTARRIDEHVADMLNEAEARARKQLEAHRAALDCLAQRLLDEEEVTGDQVEECLAMAP